MWSDLHEPELKNTADFEELFAKKGGGVVRKKALSESFGCQAGCLTAGERTGAETFSSSWYPDAQPSS